MMDARANTAECFACLCQAKMALQKAINLVPVFKPIQGRHLTYVSEISEMGNLQRELEKVLVATDSILGRMAELRMV